MKSIQDIPSGIKSKLLAIKAIITDVDGVLTDGGIIYDDKGIEYKKFNSKDGQIVRPLREAGFLTGVITGRKSMVVQKRCEELNFDFHYHGIKDKVNCIMKVKENYGLSFNEIAYIGDDLGDLALITKVGFGACPEDSPSYIKEASDWVLENPGGRGCYRELADLILRVQNKMEVVLNQFRG